MKELKSLVSKVELNSDQEKQQIRPIIKRKVMPRDGFGSNSIDSVQAGDGLRVEEILVSTIKSNTDEIPEKQDVFRSFFEEKLSEILISEPKNKKYKKQCSIVCHICAKSLKGQTRIDRHIFYDHDNSPKSDHKCETCTAYFFNQTDLMLHNKEIHGGEKMCDQCGETFDMPSLLKQHYKNVHSVFTINRTCKTCGYEGKTTGSSSKSLHAHMLQKHPDPERLTCQICNHLSTSLRDTYFHFQVRIKFSSHQNRKNGKISY